VPRTARDIYLDYNDVETAGKNLRDFLDPARVCSSNPLVVICFDESHSLTDTIENADWTRFSEMCRALRSLATFPFFTLFLSTSAKFHRLSASPQQQYDPLYCIRILKMDLFAPITKVGFDEFAEHVAADGT
jgi:hypothetical protein